MRRIFMIDSENVGTSFMEGANTLNSEDKVIYFKGNSTPKAELEILRKLSEKKIELEIIERHTEVSKNALDFQLCTYAGFLIDKLPLGSKLYIITNDKGYDASIAFLKKLAGTKIDIKRASNFTEKTKAETDRQELNEVLKDYAKYVRKTAAESLIKTTNKQQLHDYLQQRLNKNDCDKVYYLLKERFA